MSSAPLRFEVHAGLALFGVTGTLLLQGRSTARVMLWDPGPNRISVAVEDRAGHFCEAGIDVVYGTP